MAGQEQTGALQWTARRSLGCIDSRWYFYLTVKRTVIVFFWAVLSTATALAPLSTFRPFAASLLSPAGLSLQLALIGGVAGLYAADGVLTVATLITLFGIATRNGVMLVQHIRHLVEREGVSDPLEAVVRGAAERLVPILMTALAAGIALVPLAIATGEPGSEIQAPMALVILCGLISSTLLNMLVVPSLYLRFGAMARK